MFGRFEESNSLLFQKFPQLSCCKYQGSILYQQFSVLVTSLGTSNSNSCHCFSFLTRSVKGHHVDFKICLPCSILRVENPLVTQNELHNAFQLLLECQNLRGLRKYTGYSLILLSKRPENNLSSPSIFKSKKSRRNLILLY